MPSLNSFPPGTPPACFHPPPAPSVKMDRVGVKWLPTLRGQNSYTGDRDGSSLDRDGSSLYRREIEDCHFAQVWVSRWHWDDGLQGAAHEVWGPAGQCWGSARPSGLAQGYSWLCEGVEPASNFGAVVSRFWGEGQPGPHSKSSSSRAQAGGLLCTTGSRRTGIELSTQWVPFWNILQPWLQGRLPTDTGLGTIPGSPGT